MLLFSLIAVLLAAPRDDLDAGDRAWFAGDRQAAAEHWRLAAQAPASPPDVVAMAEVRLLHLSGNLGMAWHGPRADRALSDCPPGEPRCDLAWADYEIFTGLLGLPYDRERALRATRRAAAALPGPAQARLVLLSAAPPGSLLPLERDALGEGVLAHGGWPRGPGTWLVSLGFSGAPGLGVGVSGRFLHPDLAYADHRLDLAATLTSRGIGQLRLGYRSPPQAAPRLFLAEASVARLRLDDYATGTTLSVARADLWGAPGLRRDAGMLWLGPLLRVDLLGADAPLAGHGGVGGVRWQPAPPLALTLRAEVSLADYPHHRTDLDLIGAWPQGDTTVLAGRLALAESLGSSAPWWHRPAAGGGTYLRSAPANRWRADLLGAVTLELRQALVGPLGGVIFAEAAVVEGTHGGLGGGLRLALPPKPLNTLRLDLAWSLTASPDLFVTAGWGEAF